MSVGLWTGRRLILMKEEELKEFGKIFREELCEEGQRLWDAVAYHKPNSYDDYRRHLLQCKKCQEGLELRENDLENIKENIKDNPKRMSVCRYIKYDGELDVAICIELRPACMKISFVKSNSEMIADINVKDEKYNGKEVRFETDAEYEERKRETYYSRYIKYEGESDVEVCVCLCYGGNCMAIELWDSDGMMIAHIYVRDKKYKEGREIRFETDKEYEER